MTAGEDDALMRGFILGVTLSQHAHNLPPGGGREFEALREIAAGSLTLVSTAEELGEVRGMPEEVVEFYRSRRPAIQKQQRADTERIVSQLPPQRS